MATRVKLELDPETFGRLVKSAVAEQRPADWQAEVILRRALGTWEEPHTGYPVLAPAASPDPPNGGTPEPVWSQERAHSVCCTADTT